MTYLAVQASALDLDQAARAEATRAVESYWRLGEILRRIQETDAWRDLDYASFGAYVEEALGFSVRKALYLVQIRRELDGVVDEVQAAKIGWSRLVVVASAPLRDRAQLLEVAASKSYRELQAAAVEALPEAERKERRTVLKFAVEESAAPVIERALAAAALKCDMAPEDAPRGVLLEMICADYLSGASGW